MNLTEYEREKDNLDAVRKWRARVEFLHRLNAEDHEEFIEQMMNLACNWEEDDYFGTEGMEV